MPLSATAQEAQQSVLTNLNLTSDRYYCCSCHKLLFSIVRDNRLTRITYSAARVKETIAAADINTGTANFLCIASTQ